MPGGLTYSLLPLPGDPCAPCQVLYTPRNLPFSMAPVLPNAANAAFLAMLYAGKTANAAFSLGEHG